MKKIILLWFGLATLVCCKKTNYSNEAVIMFSQTIDNISINEPVLLSFGNNNQSIPTSWQVNTIDTYDIKQAGKYATISFAQPGEYLIKGILNEQACLYTIKVTNQVYNEFTNQMGIKASKRLYVNDSEEINFKASSGLANGTWSVLNPTDRITYIDSNGVGAKFSSRNTHTVLFDSIHGLKWPTMIWFDKANDASKKQIDFMAGESIQITPTKEIVNNKVNILFQVQTKLTYQCNTDSILSSAIQYGVNNYSLHFGGIYMSNSMCKEVTPATCVLKINDIKAGDNNVFFQVGNKLFHGVIKYINGTITFNNVNNEYINFSVTTL